MKSNIHKFFKNNEALESEGIWFTLSDEIGFKLARFGGANSVRIKSALAKHYKPYAKQVETGTLEATKERQIMAKVFVEACILDWKGVEIDGKITPFSKEVALDFFLELPELTETLIAYANDAKNYREELGNF